MVAKARRAARRSWLRQPYLLLRVALDGHDHFNHFSILQIGEENLAVLKLVKPIILAARTWQATWRAAYAMQE